MIGEFISDEEMKAMQSAMFDQVEVGMVVELESLSEKERHASIMAWVVSKDQSSRLLRCLMLNRDRLGQVQKGELVLTEVLQERLLNIHETYLHERAFREGGRDEVLCRSCHEPVWSEDDFTLYGKEQGAWLSKPLDISDPQYGKKNYRVHSDGYCYHIDCEDVHRLE